MERMVTIILDTNRKKELLFQQKVKRIIVKANNIMGIVNIRIVDEECGIQQFVKTLFKYKYPVSLEFDKENLNARKLDDIINLSNGDHIIIPFFEGSDLSIQFTIVKKNDFYGYFLKENCLNSITIVNQTQKRILDFEFGESCYELRTYDYILKLPTQKSLIDPDKI